MPTSNTRTGILSACLAFGMIAAAPSLAQDLDYLDTLSDASVDEEGGIQAAREQAARGEYLEALATLERVLAQHPKSREGRLIHALYLCKIDDVQGGLVELNKLKKKEFGKDLLNEAKQICENGEAS